MTSAIASIQKDHQRFGVLLRVFDQILADAERGVPANLELLDTIIDYVAGFMDQYHHPKEDEYLFRVLRRRQPALEARLNDMREDHYQGRRALERLRTALNQYTRTSEREALVRLRAAFAAYAELERRHIGAEEREILPTARATLTHEDWVEVNAAFAANQDPLFSDKRQRRFELLFNTIEVLAPPPWGRGEAA